MTQTVMYDFTNLLIVVGIIAGMFLIGLIIWCCIATSDLKQADGSVIFWRDKYFRLLDEKGRLDSDAKNLTSENRDLKERIECLLELNAELRGQVDLLEDMVN